MSGGYHREPGCQCAESELNNWRHDPWCPLNPLWGKRPQMILVFDPPHEKQARRIVDGMRAVGSNIIAVSMRTLNGTEQSRWLVQVDQIMVLCHPQQLGALSSLVQKEYTAWKEVYQEEADEEEEEEGER